MCLQWIHDVDILTLVGQFSKLSQLADSVAVFRRGSEEHHRDVQIRLLLYLFIKSLLLHVCQVLHVVAKKADDPLVWPSICLAIDGNRHVFNYTILLLNCGYQGVVQKMALFSPLILIE